MYIVIADYRATKKGKPNTYLISQHPTLSEAQAERDRHVREYGSELETRPVIALQVEP